tara:strand:- start:1032 stop:1628 length:597 start_codon:yes stop_codon:yes gene_type:complete
MKILAFVDLHSSVKALDAIVKKVKKEKPSVIVCAGDLTIFEQGLRYILYELSKLKIPCLIVHGNHETEDSLGKACKLFPNLIFLHKKTYVAEENIFFGYGGGGFSIEDKNFEKSAKMFKDKIKGYNKRVMITHAPPYKTKLDKIMEKHCGSKPIKKFIEENKISLAVCGHLHENAGKEDKVKNALVVNPGPLSKIINV